ncbi:Quinone oxidoreductase-like protein 2 [Trachymyrmex cornetzi]|uniref:Quinone oxidoreductase-like protein 2 n=1 Tax=Trachymyrmex cornetzi TaxID=471704 RepID=A0A195E2C1_9HYME|nr:Quinone oxidoreductase-like protein 2 [Trachymyrmex cornetzi]
MRRVSLKNAAAVTDDYFSALLAIGRRARIQRNECLLVNAKHSRSALAVIDLATRVFGAKPIAICDDARRAQLCADLGATIICRNGRCLPYKLKKIGGKEEVRVMIETEGGPCFQNVVKCLEHDALIAVLGSAQNKRSLDFSFVPINCMMFAVAAEHYKIADTLVYRSIYLSIYLSYLCTLFLTLLFSVLLYRDTLHSGQKVRALSRMRHVFTVTVLKVLRRARLIGTTGTTSVKASGALKRKRGQIRFKGPGYIRRRPDREACIIWGFLGTANE